MKTLRKHFKTCNLIRVGTYLTCKIDGSLYVLSQKVESQDTTSCHITNVVNGMVVDCKIMQTHPNLLTQDEFMSLLEDVTKQRHKCVPFGKTEEAVDVLWYILSRQEVVGKFAAMLLRGH